MDKKLLIRIGAVIMTIFLILGLIVPALAAPEKGVVIKLHYNRPDGDYTDWSVWFWNFGAEGVDIPFAEENGEMVATFTAAAGATKVGFIVKLPNWAAKDVNEDQFIDVAAYVSGTVHVYVQSGVKGFEVKPGEDLVSGVKLTGAVYKEGSGVNVTMTAPIGDGKNAFAIRGPEGAVTINGVNAAGTMYTLFTDELNVHANYTLIYEGEEYSITMPNVYSTEKFEAAYTYAGNDLGATWTREKTAFRVWAPTASSVKVKLYAGGDPSVDDLTETLEMTAAENGTWVAEKEGDLAGTYYTYEVAVGDAVNEACDPYARTTGVNGKRAMVIDLASTNPEGWENDKDPNGGKAITDAVIYELHVRDLSIDESSGITNKGKYLGLIETGTKNANGIPTGLDHMKNLGITHLHLLPVYDYGSVDESKLDTPQFNWGYDPVNYNVPEGSYATDPYNGQVRVQEFKQMVKGLHDNGISVVMDVVYNHVYNAGEFCFNKIVPGYFSRILDGGFYSNGSGCGNDTASERSMVKKYIVDSVKYWADEYHIDGFRFDLVGLIDTETINAVIEEVHKTHPNVIFYGEGWTMTTSVTKEGYTMTTQVNSTETPKFAFFSDTIRDGLKGSVFNETEKGYVSGADGRAATVAKCFPGVYSWCKSPTQSVNYASCHDNLSLFDKLALSNPNDSVEDRIKMNNLAAAIYMTSQGIPFMQAGEEMLRSKPLGDGTYDHNSYASPDSVNSIKWDNLNEQAYADTLAYYQGLIAFRKAHPALRMTDAQSVAAAITAVKGLDANVNAFQILGAEAGDSASGIFVIFNPNKTATTVQLPAGKWGVCINGEQAGTEVLATAEGSVTVDAISAMVLVQNETAVETPEAPAEEEPTNIVPVIMCGIAAVIAAGAALFAAIKFKKK